MTKRVILALALKFLGVITLIYAVDMLFQALQMMPIVLRGNMFGVNNPVLYVAISSIAVLFTFFAANILLFKAESVSRVLVRDDCEIAISDSQNWLNPAFVIALKVLGIYVLVYAVPHLANILAQSLIEIKQSYGSISVSAGDYAAHAWSRNWPGIIQYCMEIAFGAWLLFGASGIARVLLRNRNEDVTEP